MSAEDEVSRALSRDLASDLMKERAKNVLLQQDLARASKSLELSLKMGREIQVTLDKMRDAWRTLRPVVRFESTDENAIDIVAAKEFLDTNAP